MSRIRKLWEQKVDEIESDFLAGGYSDEEIKTRLTALFDPDTAEIMWSVLHHLRNYGRP